MNKAFLEIFQNELRFLRESGDNFAKIHPQIASNLGLNQDGIKDPFIERLIESCAFLTARVQQRLNYEQGEFAINVLERLAPNWLLPVPSMATISLEVDLTAPEWGNGKVVPKGTRFHLNDASLSEPLIYSTSYDVKLLPLKIVEASFEPYIQSLPNLVMQNLKEGSSFLSIKLSSQGILPLDKMDLDGITLTLTEDPARSHQIFKTMLEGSIKIIAWTATEAGINIQSFSKEVLRVRGFDNNESAIPQAISELTGTRILREYFSFAEKFLNIRLPSFNNFIKKSGSKCNEINIIFVFDSNNEKLLGKINPKSFNLFAVPVINLFQKRCDPVVVDATRHEQHVVVDKFKPLNYELYKPLKVRAITANAQTFNLSPYGSDGRFENSNQQSGFYSIRRLESIESTRKQVPGYKGEDSLISFSLCNNDLSNDPVESIHIEALVTQSLFNVMLIQTNNWTVDMSLPIHKINTVRQPTQKRENVNIDKVWMAAQLLSDNVLRYSNKKMKDCSPVFKRWLSTMSDEDCKIDQRRIDSLKNVEVIHKYERNTGNGPISWVRNALINVDLDTQFHSDEGSYLFGQIIRHALLGFLDVNQSLSVQISLDDLKLKPWPSLMGPEA